MRVLVAEDEPKVQSFIKKALEEAGIVVDAASSVTDLLTCLKTTRYDVVLLDRLLRGKDSLTVLPKIRECAPHAKILVLSALAGVEEKVKGLTEGADDYLGKPFHVSELIARIKTLTRRSEQQKKTGSDNFIIYKDLKIDLVTQKVYRGEKKVDLTGKEFRLLCLLVKPPGQIHSKMHIIDQVWDLNHYPESNVVEVTIASLRVKLEKGMQPLIHSRRGVGYWLGEP